MKSFNYEKAWFCHCVKEWKALPITTKAVHSLIAEQVQDLSQGRDLNIPLNATIEELAEPLPTEELARLSRLSYFIGHWQPGNTPALFENSAGQSWKVSNVLDQILHKRLTPTHNLQIHQGTLRVTFSDRNNWLWEEFGLATQENIDRFNICGLPFGRDTFAESAHQLKTGDLWGDPEDSTDYTAFLEEKKTRTIKELKLKLVRGQEKLKGDIKSLELELKTQEKLITLGVDLDTICNNLIYYKHTNTFTFGWRTSLTEQQAPQIKKLITGALPDQCFTYKTREK